MKEKNLDEVTTRVAYPASGGGGGVPPAKGQNR